MIASKALVILTREPAANRRWAAALRRHGLATAGVPMIKTTLASLTPAQSAALHALKSFDWIIVTSARGVTALHTLATAVGANLTGAPPVAAVGKATAAAGRRYGFTIKFTAQPATAAMLAAALTPIRGRRLLLARTNLAGTGLGAALTDRGAQVTELTVYHTAPRATPSPQLETLMAASQIRCLTFASPSAVQGAVQSLNPAMLTQARQLPVITLGPTTTAAAHSYGFTHIHQAAEPTLTALIAAIRANT